MIIKCPNCNGALEYNVEQGLLFCKFCGSFFTAEEIGGPETDPAEEESVNTGQQPQGYGTWQPQGYGAQQPQGYGAQQPQGYGAQQPQGYGNQTNSEPERTQISWSNAGAGGTGSARYGAGSTAGTASGAASDAGSGFSTGSDAGFSSGSGSEFAAGAGFAAGAAGAAIAGTTEPEHAKYDSMEQISNEAMEARQAGMTGNFAYDIPKDVREQNRNSYYQEQEKLREEYLNPPKVDYTKPYVSKRTENQSEMTKTPDWADNHLSNLSEKREARREAYYKQQQMLHDAYVNRPKTDLNKPFSGTTWGNMTPEEIERRRAQEKEDLYKKDMQLGRDASLDFAVEKASEIHRKNFENYQNKYGTVPQNMIPKTGGVRYTASGARVINDRGGVFLTTDTPIEDGVATIDNKIYTCTTCGAELALTGTETSSFCAYCGQPTIVYDRMEKSLMPDSIIPFVITKDEALKKIRNRLDKGLLIPREVKNFEVERLRGIYIPYWLFDANYDDSMVIRSKVKSGKTTVTKYYRVNTHCNLYYYPVDASRNLNDNTSRKLEPYDYSGMRPFNIAYMSGFYSDRFDMSADTMMMTSMYRAQSQMYVVASKRVPGTPQGMTESSPIFHVKKKYYTMLPAWFMTFRYEGMPYTIMVNGQNGKVVGAVPYSKAKLYGLMACLTVVLGAIFVPMSIYLIPAMFDSSSGIKFFIFMIMVVGTFFAIGYNNISKYQKNMELTREEQITNYVKERQDAD